MPQFQSHLLALEICLYSPVSIFLLFLIWLIEIISIPFKIVLTRVTLYGLEQLMDIWRTDRNIPHSQFTMLTLYEDLGFLRATFRQEKLLSNKGKVSEMQKLHAHCVPLNIFWEAKFSFDKNSWGSPYFRLLTLRWVCFSVLTATQTKICFCMFKIIMRSLDSNLYEGWANLHCTRTRKILHLKGEAFFLKLVCKRGRNDLWYSPWAPVPPSFSASWHIKGINFSTCWTEPGVCNMFFHEISLHKYMQLQIKPSMCHI